jgi:hypothetical protein
MTGMLRRVRRSSKTVIVLLISLEGVGLSSTLTLGTPLTFVPLFIAPEVVDEGRDASVKSALRVAGPSVGIGRILPLVM